MVTIIVSAIILLKNNTTTLEMTPELSRTQAYADVIDGDEIIVDEDNNEITAIQFDAFF